MSYVAECEKCGVLERGSLEEAGDAADDHERFHDVRVKRVATDGSGHVCEACGETFRTLTRLRLHENDDCPERQTYDQIDPDAADADLQAAEGLLTCRSCGQENPSADFEETPSFADGDYHLIVEFDCRHCGFENENRVVMEGVDREDLDRLPPHLRPDEADGDLVTDGGRDQDETEFFVADEDREIDPSLLTDGGQSVDGTGQSLEERIHEQLVVEEPDETALVDALEGGIEIVDGRWSLNIKDTLSEREQKDRVFTYLLGKYAAARVSDGDSSMAATREELYQHFDRGLVKDVCEHGWVRHWDGQVQIRPQFYKHLAAELSRRYADTDTDSESEPITDGGVQRWHYQDANSARSLAGVGTQNRCRNGTRGCSGPHADGLPCSECFFQDGEKS